MLHSQTHLRTRPVGAGYLRAFEAVARHLNFRAAAEEMALTQSAVSRQIQSLEQEIGVPLFLRHTRAVELTGAGSELLAAVVQALPRIDATVRHIRHSAGRKTLSVTTFASFASMWLIPRLEDFQRRHPDIDIRVEGSDSLADLDVAEVDVALRYGREAAMPAQAERLFGEQITPVASRWLLQGGARIDQPQQLAQHTLIEASDAHRTHYDWLLWARWFSAQGLADLQPQRWLYFNFAYQMMQAELAGQGVALARMPLVAHSLASGDLVELMPERRLDSPLAYWLIVTDRGRPRPETQAFCDWLREQAQATRAAVGDGQGAPA